MSCGTGATNLLVVGAPGAGKTTWCRAVAEDTGRVHIEVDRHRYQEGTWIKVSPEELCSRIEAQVAAAGDRGFVVDTSLWDATDPLHSRMVLARTLLPRVHKVVVFKHHPVEHAVANVRARHEERQRLGTLGAETAATVDRLCQKMLFHWDAIHVALTTFALTTLVEVQKVEPWCCQPMALGGGKE